MGGPHFGSGGHKSAHFIVIGQLLQISASTPHRRYIYVDALWTICCITVRIFQPKPIHSDLKQQKIARIPHQRALAFAVKV